VVAEVHSHDVGLVGDGADLAQPPQLAGQRREVEVARAVVEAVAEGLLDQHEVERCPRERRDGRVRQRPGVGGVSRRARRRGHAVEHGVAGQEVGADVGAGASTGQ
jgi:hypothetical protein